MIEGCYYLDRWVTLEVNGHHTAFTDALFLILSNKFFFLGVIAAFLVLVYSKKRLRFGRYDYPANWKIMLIVMLAIGATFAVTDIVSHDLIKPAVRRLRPAYDPWIHDMVRLPSGRGGVYTFVSNHAANCFGFAVLSALVIRKKFYTITIIAICLAVNYSRIYLGRHFLTDILGGTLFGALAGFMMYLLLKFLLGALMKSSRMPARAS